MLIITVNNACLTYIAGSTSVPHVIFYNSCAVFDSASVFTTKDYYVLQTEFFIAFDTN